MEWWLAIGPHKLVVITLITVQSYKNDATIIDRFTAIIVFDKANAHDRMPLGPVLWFDQSFMQWLFKTGFSDPEAY